MWTCPWVLGPEGVENRQPIDTGVMEGGVEVVEQAKFSGSATTVAIAQM
jgi:hypothetical protein